MRIRSLNACQSCQRFGSFPKSHLLDSLVNNDGVVGLVLHLALAPLLLLTVIPQKSVSISFCLVSHIQHNRFSCPLEALGYMLEGGEDDETYPALEPAIAAAAFWAVKICQRTFFPMYPSL